MKLKIRDATNGGYYVRVVASNGEKLVHSEVYTAKHNAKHCAELIKANAGSAEIVDETA